MTLAVVAAVLGAYMSLLFVISLLRQDNGTADIGYGLGCVVAVSCAAFMEKPQWHVLVLCGLVWIWGVRLATRIYRKNKGKPEDFRYKAWRDAWEKNFVVRSFFQIYLLQGVVIYMVALPVILAIVFPKPENLSILTIGVSLWIIGFLFEALGDYQLDRFIKDPANKGKILTSGLWRYSRHPNYFGESVMWWGIAIAACGVSSLWIVGFLSPVLITYLLLFVSGVPMLEKRWQQNAEWQEYKRKTSVFVPLPPSNR